MKSSLEPPEPHTKGHRGMVVRVAAMILVAAALLLLIMGWTILRNEPVASHAPLTSAAKSAPAPLITSPSTLPAVATVPGSQPSLPELSAYQQAKASGDYLAGSAAVDALRVYDQVPPGSKLLLTFPREGKKQISSTFLIIGEDVGADGRTWYQIRLPIRPNGSTGWVRATDLTTAAIKYDMRIDLSDHRLELYESQRLKKSYPIGVGTDDTPTPPGNYYITIKLKPPNPNSVYGVLAMGVSGFSENLTNWPDGGQLGIHGTNDPSSIGKNVSHGCIRLQNADILEISQYVAFGTPVFIQE